MFAAMPGIPIMLGLKPACIAVKWFICPCFCELCWPAKLGEGMVGMVLLRPAVDWAMLALVY